MERMDLDVFYFINSDQCNSYYDLEQFLQNKYLPLTEEYLFYFLGKNKGINKLEIEEAKERSPYFNYYDLIFESLSLWSEYLNNHAKEKEYIKYNFSETELQNLTKDKIHQLFISNGWERINSDLKEKEESIIEYENDKLAKKIYEEEMRNPRNYYSNDDGYCGACDSDPCMCSDPDKTSTKGWL